MTSLTVHSGHKALFFEAIAYGLKNQIITQENIAVFQKQGAEMTVNYANQYLGNMYYEECLSRSANIVLGVCNYALENAIKNNADEAARKIVEHGLVHWFRKGWGSILEILKKYGKEKSKEAHKELAQLLMCEKNVFWDGIKNIEDYIKSFDEELYQTQAMSWLKKFEKNKKHLYDENIDDSKLLNTIFISLAISDAPFYPITGRELISSIVFVRENKDRYMDSVKRFVSDLCPEILRPSLLGLYKKETSIYSQLKKIGKQENHEGDISFNLASENVLLSSDLNSLVDSAELFKQEHAVHENEFLIMRLAQEDEFMQGIFVDLLLERKISWKELLSVISFASVSSWRHKINWDNFVISDVVSLFNADFSEKRLVQDYCEWYINAKRYVIPYAILVRIEEHCPEMIQKFIKFKTSVQLKNIAGDSTLLFVFLPKNKLVSYVIELSDNKVVKLIKRVNAFFNASFAAKAVIDIIKLKRDKKITKEDAGNDSVIFGSEGIHDCVKKTFEPLEYRKIERALRLV